MLKDGTWRDRQRAAKITRAPKGEIFDKRELLDVWTQECESVGIEFPEPKSLATIVPKTVRFYELDSQQPIETQEQQLFLTTTAPFRKIEEAIAVNLPMIPPEPTWNTIQEYLRFNRVDEAIALMAEDGHIISGEGMEHRLIHDWSAMPLEQRQNSVLVANDMKVIIPQLRAAMKAEWGELINLKQRVRRPKSALRVGDYIEPLRTYQRRQLSLDTLYQLQAFRRGKLELIAPDGSTLLTRNDFQYRVWTGQDYPVYEFEPLVWTHLEQPSEFAIVSVEDHTALIQYRDGDLASLDIAIPLPIDSAIAYPSLPPGQFESVYVLCDEGLDLKALAKQARTVKLYGKDVKSIADFTKTFIAQHDPIYGSRWAIEQELRQEKHLGAASDIGSLSAFREQHRPPLEPNGIDLKRISSAVRRSGQWRQLQRHEGVIRATRSVIGLIQSKLEGLQQYRTAVEDLCSNIEQTVTRNRTRKLARAFQTRQVTKTLTPVLQKVNQSLQEYEQAAQEKRETIAELTAVVDAITRNLKNRELIAIAHNLRAQIPKSRFARPINGGFQVETRSLIISVQGEKLAISSKNGRGLLAEANGENAALNKLSERDMEICTRLAKKLSQRKRSISLA